MYDAPDGQKEHSHLLGQAILADNLQTFVIRFDVDSLPSFKPIDLDKKDKKLKR